MVYYDFLQIIQNILPEICLFLNLFFTRKFEKKKLMLFNLEQCIFEINKIFRKEYCTQMVYFGFFFFEIHKPSGL